MCQIINCYLLVTYLYITYVWLMADMQEYHYTPRLLSLFLNEFQVCF